MKQIAKFKLSELRNFDTIQETISQGYKKTGLKFSVHFNGSKGYLDNIEISCELSSPARTPIQAEGKEICLFHDYAKGLLLK